MQTPTKETLLKQILSKECVLVKQSPTGEVVSILRAGTADELSDYMLKMPKPIDGITIKIMKLENNDTK